MITYAKAMVKKIKIPSTSPFDKVVYLASVGYPLTALPQIVKVFSRHSAHDLSLTSWVLYLVLESILLAYAIQKRLVPIIVQDGLWIVVYVILIVGILVYGS